MPPLTAEQRRLYAELLLHPEVDVIILNTRWVAFRDPLGLEWPKRHTDTTHLRCVSRAERLAALIAYGTLTEKFVRAAMEAGFSGRRVDLMVVDELTDAKDAP